jgi:hypothetical protein
MTGKLFETVALKRLTRQPHPERIAERFVRAWHCETD